MPQNAGIIIIGEEILNGNVIDSNSPFLCRKLYSLGVCVGKVTTIPDDVETISKEIFEFSKSFDLVITTGGVGPTHNDVTYEGVARAFKVSLKKDQQFQKFYNEYLRSLNYLVADKLIKIPSTSDVILVQLEAPLIMGFNYFPIAKVQNVFCLPGSPFYVQEIFTSLSKIYFQNPTVVYISRDIYLKVHEIHVTKILNNLADHFNDQVSIRVYQLPEKSEIIPAQAKISIMSSSLHECLKAEKECLSHISPKWLTFPKAVLPDFDFVERFISLETHLSSALKTTFMILDDCFRGYNMSEIFISFNGGKDCTILFNLIYYYYYYLKKGSRAPLKLVYFQEEDSFSEIDEFIKFISSNYNVELRILPWPIKPSLERYLSTEPNIKVCFLGVRNADPKSNNLKHTQETDAGWPKMIRVFPILHWSYKDVWDFIRCANIPYCSLYNLGYTSLGSKKNSAVNPALGSIDQDGSQNYKPAFLLDEDSSERHGRECNQIKENVGSMG